MKTIISTLLLVISSLTVLGQDIKDPYVFEVGKEYNLFGDNINIRSKANTTSEVIAQLPITNKVEILEKTDVVFNYNGADWSFYKIKSDSIVGYVTGGLIAINENFKFSNNGFSLTTSKCSIDRNNSSYTYSVEVEKGTNYDVKTTQKRITYFEYGNVFRENAVNTESYYENSEEYFIERSNLGTANLAEQLEVKARSTIMLRFLKDNEDFIEKNKLGRKEGEVIIDGVFSKVYVPCYIEVKNNTIIFGFEKRMEI